MSERGQLSIVDSAQKNQRQNRAQQRHCHIELGIPRIPLSGEKTLGGITGEDGNDPFKQFVQSTESQAN